MSPIALIKGFLPSFGKGSQIVNITSITGQFGTPLRTFYCTSKFAIDGFSKALAAELKDTHMCICYPAYVQTNIAKSALIGGGVAMGKTDSNIGNGLPCDVAVRDLIKAMYTKRDWITLEPNYYYTIMSRLQLILGESHNRQMMQTSYI